MAAALGWRFQAGVGRAAPSRAESAQQGFKPKIVTIGKALLFPSVIDSLGDRGNGLSTEIWWGPTHPYKSGLTGQSTRELCDAYTAATKRPWTQPLGFQHALLEVAVDVLTRAKNVKAPESILESIVATNYKSIVGPVNWTGKPVKNVTKTPLVAGQWRKGPKGFELVIAGFSARQAATRFRFLGQFLLSD